MNKIMLIGNLTRDPELSQAPNGIAVCKFSIAVQRKYTNAEGERETDFFNVIAWRGLGENCNKYLKKGSKAAVIGSVLNRQYEKNGEKRTVTEITAEDVEFLTPKTEQSSQGTPKTGKKAKSIADLEPVEDDGELPF